jgi:hypothetical protein
MRTCLTGLGGGELGFSSNGTRVGGSTFCNAIADSILAIQEVNDTSFDGFDDQMMVWGEVLDEGWKSELVRSKGRCDWAMLSPWLPGWGNRSKFVNFLSWMRKTPENPEHVNLEFWNHSKSLNKWKDGLLSIICRNCTSLSSDFDNDARFFFSIAQDLHMVGQWFEELSVP